MSHFRQVIAGLIDRINSSSRSNYQVAQTLDLPADFCALDWLESQPHFPKFYWYSRGGQDETVALGQVYTFSDAAPAYQVLGEGQRVWGGKAFDNQNAEMPSFFFLPQIELSRDGAQWSLCANVGPDKQLTIQALQRLELQVCSLPTVNSCITSVTHCPDKAQWSTLVGQALQQIGQDRFKKVVLARETSVTLNKPLSGPQLLKASQARNHHSFHFLLTLNSESCFVGSTPERLYSRNDVTLETEALAGTSGRDSNAEKDQALADWLTHDAKNQQENLYVVDDIVERLTPHAVQIEVQQQARLVRLRKVQHLKRSIHATLQPGINGVQLLSALQPTAAVAGLPREEAMSFIQQQEPFERGWYSGSMGYISHQRAELCVAIRSARVSGNRLQLYAGAGIVAGSDAEYEWQELDGKMSTLLSLMANATEDGTEA